ncbi:hypothetical protein MNEG_2579 [Monoraphidium neglectum]|uniref:Uncharacterized protein n=1 Tax=Monoraphidium neglectum TaxID=145388 RepID=A0A0D2MS18_9CHLO|nr:hypothetical protein MNEG_2579 [Monoraphidium neglectum]KIZ05375.1 hypothetical protein MNEG_2579 [Monoraphidium neglectum]|eukprot:XP_013904394.1 hypothetical protein MNEG_2579 [Monoraphidium neglectum]
MSDPSYSAAGARISAAARLRAALRPPLELAVQEVEMALTHRDYGRWRPYSVDGGRGHGRGADLDSGAPLSSHPEL